MRSAGVVVILAVLAAPLQATVTSGPGGSGVTVGNSSLITTLDYSDSFTGTADGGNPGRITDGTFPVNLPGINMEANHGNAPRAWTNRKWSLVKDGPGGGIWPTGASPYPGPSGSGTATGFTQTGGGGMDWGTSYGLRNDFVVQTDFVQTVDRIDITVGGAAGNIFDPSNLSVFFRRTAHPTYPEIGLFNPTVGEHNTSLSSGIPSAGAWHNYAVRVNVPARELEVFVDEVSRGLIDLDTVAGGVFAGVPLSNAVVSVGYAGGDRGWSDNAQIGAAGDPIPEPATMLLAGLAFTGLGGYIRRRRQV